MSHDKLLALMETHSLIMRSEYDADRKCVFLRLAKFPNALRAVVELHKPFETTPPWEYVKYMACDACESWTNDGAYFLPYPCPTIQAIEKELK